MEVVTVVQVHVLVDVQTLVRIALALVKALAEVCVIALVSNGTKSILACTIKTIMAFYGAGQLKLNNIINVNNGNDPN